MKLRHAMVLCGLLFSCLCTAGAQDISGQGEGSLQVVMEYLGPALKDRSGIARIFYVTECSSEGAPLPFPEVNAQAAPRGASGIAAIREIFSKDQNVQVSEGSAGIIRVMIGQLSSSAILQTKIHSLALDQEERYDPVLAVNAILNCKEVEVDMRKLGIEQPLTVTHAGINPFNKNAPHLRSRLVNLTVDQALNLIAKTFKGVVMYEECTEAGKRLFSLEFIQTTGS